MNQEEFVDYLMDCSSDELKDIVSSLNEHFGIVELKWEFKLMLLNKLGGDQDEK